MGALTEIFDAVETPYGFCPQCGAPGHTRERRPGGNDTCAGGCTYPSASAVQYRMDWLLPVGKRKSALIELDDLRGLVKTNSCDPNRTGSSFGRGNTCASGDGEFAGLKKKRDEHRAKWHETYNEYSALGSTPEWESGDEEVVRRWNELSREYLRHMRQTEAVEEEMTALDPLWRQHGVKPNPNVTVKLSKGRGDNRDADIYLNGSRVGQIDGFWRYDDDIREVFVTYDTKLRPQARGEMAYQTALARIASEYEGGTWSKKFHMSHQIQRAIQKVPGIEWNDDKERWELSQSAAKKFLAGEIQKTNSCDPNRVGSSFGQGNTCASGNMPPVDEGFLSFLLSPHEQKEVPKDAPKEPIDLAWTEDKITPEVPASKYDVELSALARRHRHMFSEVRMVDDIAGNPFNPSDSHTAMRSDGDAVEVRRDLDIDRWKNSRSVKGIESIEDMFAHELGHMIADQKGVDVDAFWDRAGMSSRPRRTSFKDEFGAYGVSSKTEYFAEAFRIYNTAKRRNESGEYIPRHWRPHLEAMVAELNGERRKTLPGCGAGSSGDPGFQPGNTCASGDADTSALAAAWGVSMEQAESMLASFAQSRERMKRLFGQPKTATPTEEELKPLMHDLGHRRAGECFNAAGEYMLHGRLEHARLVHGVVETPGGDKIAHGWVDLGDKIYDGSWTQFFDKQSYLEWTNAKAEKTYAYEDMSIKIVTTEHWGPWHETEGAYRE